MDVYSLGYKGRSSRTPTLGTQYLRNNFKSAPLQTVIEEIPPAPEEEPAPKVEEPPTVPVQKDGESDENKENTPPPPAPETSSEEGDKETESPKEETAP